MDKENLPDVVTREQWRAARKELLVQEKEAHPRPSGDQRRPATAADSPDRQAVHLPGPGRNRQPARPVRRSPAAGPAGARWAVVVPEPEPAQDHLVRPLHQRSRRVPAQGPANEYTPSSTDIDHGPTARVLPRWHPSRRRDQPFSVTVVSGCRRAVAPVTYRPEIALRCAVSEDRFGPGGSATLVRGWRAAAAGVM